ncbi:MAG: hypothetical protein AAF108_00590 [Planctomycetota bacterium]
MPGRIEAVSWSGAQVPDLRAITPMVWAKVSQGPAKEIAEGVTRKLRQRGAGFRVLHVFHPGRPGGLPDPIHGGDRVDRILDGPAITRRHRSYYAELFGRIADAGVTVDRLVLDYEGGVSLWQLGSGPQRAERMARVLADRRARARLPAEVLETPAAKFASSSAARSAYVAFNAWAASYRAEALRELVVAPAQAALGDRLLSSNYADTVPSFDVPDLNGWPIPAAMCGTDQSPPLYLLEMGNRYKGREKQKRWNVFLDHISHVRSCLAGLREAGRGPESFVPWISRPGYVAFERFDGPWFLWTALIVHMLHAGVRRFILWNVDVQKGGVNGVGNRVATQRMDDAFDSLSGTFLLREAAEVPAEQVALDADSVTTGPLTTTYEDFLEHEPGPGRLGVW